MSERAQQAYEDWKAADAKARAAETKLAQAWDGYFANRAKPPAAAMIQEISQLRAIANDRLTAAMLLMGVPPRDPGPPTQP